MFHIKLRKLHFFWKGVARAYVATLFYAHAPPRRDEARQREEGRNEKEIQRTRLIDWVYHKNRTPNTTKGPREPTPFQVVKVKYIQITWRRETEPATNANR